MATELTADDIKDIDEFSDDGQHPLVLVPVKTSPTTAQNKSSMKNPPDKSSMNLLDKSANKSPLENPLSNDNWKNQKFHDQWWDEKDK